MDQRNYAPRQARIQVEAYRFGGIRRFYIVRGVCVCVEKRQREMTTFSRVVKHSREAVVWA